MYSFKNEKKKYQEIVFFLLQNSKKQFFNEQAWNYQAEPREAESSSFMHNIL